MFTENDIRKTLSKDGSKVYDFGVKGLMVQLYAGRRIRGGDGVRECKIIIFLSDPKAWPQGGGGINNIGHTYYHNFMLTERGKVKKIVIKDLNDFIKNNDKKLIRLIMGEGALCTLFL